MSDHPKIFFFIGRTGAAEKAAEELNQLYSTVPVEDADIIVPLGGDGTMLEALHKFAGLKKPFFGMNLGTFGFLMNSYRLEKLPDRLSAAVQAKLYPLCMRAKTVDGEVVEEMAMNDVSFLRQKHQAAALRIEIDGVERLDKLIGDGIIVSTPAGSTAYNLSAGGPVVPLGANVLAMTPISAFHPRGWPGALVSDRSKMKFEILNPDKRPVSVTADSHEVRNVAEVEVWQDRSQASVLMFDPEHSLEERIRKQQFML